ncbi:MAG: prepilin-type N-terminal cleavage/methylation domain-containing protein [Candidatus Dadabacteria bacterium]|nr:prepilin-type N-terminal cleavage/methylation domain-containing protein [Candidatus Dadabacteria bacterium]MDE0520052.1 prepilin-type N-terminal cleavage/methylation domain-containing protein [Candidatus Dadabacteria bacterium]MDE0662924.1 prepilin-type N-terminal cleavage/methylation domain-containing protein [Candidatus Dadabacteria bacterium]
MKASKSSICGFTLLEVMVAVGLLAFAMVSILGIVGHNVNLATRSTNYLIATSLADDIASRIDAEGLTSDSKRSGKFENYPGFEWYLTVSPYNLTQFEAKMTIISVLITWDDGEESYEISFVDSG